MGEGAARLKRPGLGIIVLLGLAATGLAGCAGGYHGPAQAANSGAASPGYAGITTASSATAGSIATPPGDITGLEARALQHLFGTPGLVRKDYPAEVWQYRNKDCVLDIYLYPDHDRLTVAHAEARAPKISGDPLPACVAQFAQSRQKTAG
jgi:hypothetical protein